MARPSTGTSAALSTSAAANRRIAPAAATATRAGSRATTGASMAAAPTWKSLRTTMRGTPARDAAPARAVMTGTASAHAATTTSLTGGPPAAPVGAPLAPTSSDDASHRIAAWAGTSGAAAASSMCAATGTLAAGSARNRSSHDTGFSRSSSQPTPSSQTRGSARVVAMAMGAARLPIGDGSTPQIRSARASTGTPTLRGAVPRESARLEAGLGSPAASAAAGAVVLVPEVAAASNTLPPASPVCWRRRGNWPDEAFALPGVPVAAAPLGSSDCRPSGLAASAGAVAASARP
mmetsp:Transcript_4065/g.17033  ORF Transcript_4065/g.17033 Transcript_4065/m.17033 type:complete len:292 (-) Transcript_4065:981-1856(-)